MSGSKQLQVKVTDLDLSGLTVEAEIPPGSHMDVSVINNPTVTLTGPITVSPEFRFEIQSIHGSETPRSFREHIDFLHEYMVSGQGLSILRYLGTSIGRPSQNSYAFRMVNGVYYHFDLQPVASSNSGVMPDPVLNYIIQQNPDQVGELVYLAVPRD